MGHFSTTGFAFCHGFHKDKTESSCWEVRKALFSSAWSSQQPGDGVEGVEGTRHGPKKSFMAVEMAFSRQLCLFCNGASFLSSLAAREAGNGVMCP